MFLRDMGRICIAWSDSPCFTIRWLSIQFYGVIKKFVYIFNASVFVGHMAHFAPNARSESIFCKLKTANNVTAYWTVCWWVQFLLSRRMFSSKATFKKKILQNCDKLQFKWLERLVYKINTTFVCIMQVSFKR